MEEDACISLGWDSEGDDLSPPPISEEAHEAAQEVGEQRAGGQLSATEVAGMLCLTGGHLSSAAIMALAQDIVDGCGSDPERAALVASQISTACASCRTPEEFVQVLSCFPDIQADGIVKELEQSAGLQAQAAEMLGVGMSMAAAGSLYQNQNTTLAAINPVGAAAMANLLNENMRAAATEAGAGLFAANVEADPQEFDLAIAQERGPAQTPAHAMPQRDAIGIA